MTFPKPEILYRLQSVDFGTFLELWDVEEEVVVLRPLKETDLQQWEFIKDNSGQGERYKILAVATRPLTRPAYLTVTKAGEENYPRSPVPPTADIDEASTSLWRVTHETDGSYVLTTNGKDARHDVFLRVSESGMLDTVEKKISNRQLFNRSMRWKIVDYWPPMPKDTYRIRTLNGAALDIDSTLTQLSVAAVRKDYRQEWNVEPKGNGKCTIALNLKDQMYLGWQKGKDGIAKVAISKTPFDWFIKCLGEYTYSISIEHDVGSPTPLTLALSITDAEILLKPRKVAHNQIWFFESVDALSSNAKVPPPDSSTDGKRYPEINEQTSYYLKNMETGQYFTYYTYSVTPKRYFAAPGQRIYQNKIAYVGAGNTFKLSIGYKAPNNLYLSYAGNAVDVVLSEADATAWVLERANDPSGGYFYHICPAFDTTQVISGETVPGIEETQVFKVTTKKAGDPLQGWKFEL